MAKSSPTTYPAHVTDPTNYSWRERDSRRPTIPDGSIVLFEEPGRILPDKGQGTDCRSHYFLVSAEVKGGRPTLRVTHGAGGDEWLMTWDPRLLDAFAALDSDQRFRLFWTIHDAHRTSYHHGVASTTATYERAFVEGRLRKHKVRGANAYQVSIQLPEGEGLIVGGVVKVSS